jgi:hypothetical protein
MKRFGALAKMKDSLVAGQVYRRSHFEHLSTNVDRHLAHLVSSGHLNKLSYGLYASPKKTPFGEGLPEEQSLLRTFLNDDHFVVYSMSQFNSLQLGTTQLHNRRIVFNRKRAGEFKLGSRSYYFYRWREAPKQLTEEFLVVELFNRLDELGENKEQVLRCLSRKIPEYNQRKLSYALSHYGTLSTQKILVQMMKNDVEDEVA